jgi:hypothetical protein
MRMSICYPGWPQTHSSSASASQVAEITGICHTSLENRLLKITIRAGGLAQEVKHLPSKREALSSCPNATKKERKKRKNYYKCN